MGSIPEPDESHITVLKRNFGHAQFRPMQWKIIYTILKGTNDQCVVMATGYGKSLCYQYPAVYTGGMSIVVSPLISLMQDQVLSLKMLNIPACFLGSAQKERMQTVDGILNGEYRVVYVTPEFCSNEYGQDLLQKVSSSQLVTLIAIDEAHCVSQWGFDFRPSYRKLGSLRNILPDIPFLTVTATATPQVRNDICFSLHLRNPQIICTDFDRPNLFLAVWMKGNSAFNDLQKFMKRDGVKLKFPGPTIIYCPTKKATEGVALNLCENGIKCTFYHADLPMEKRRQVHEDFVKDISQVVAATVAFGMGIDKPDIRLVIHYGAPKEIESYYQEIGRAGRDGLDASCHVFYNSRDFVINSLFLSHLTGKFREHRESMARLMERYLESLDCRRKLLLSYFDSTWATKGYAPKPNCCDNCTKRLNSSKTESCTPEIDIKEDAILLLKAIKLFGGRFGITTPILFLRGSHSKKVYNADEKHELFAAGRHKTEAWWKAIGRLLLREELAEHVKCNGSSKFISTVRLTQAGEDYLKYPVFSETVVLIPSNEIQKLFKNLPKPTQTYQVNSEISAYKFEPPKKLLSIGECSTSNSSISASANVPLVNQEPEENKETEESSLQYDVYYALIELRTRIAAKHGCMPYMVANNKILLELAKLRPSTKEELGRVEGFGEAKVERFGSEILEKIKEVKENFNFVPTKNESETTAESEKDDNTCVVKDKIDTKLSQDLCTDLWGEEDDSFLDEISLEENEKTNKSQTNIDQCSTTKTDSAFQSCIETGLRMESSLPIKNQTNELPDNKVSNEEFDSSTSCAIENLKPLEPKCCIRIPSTSVTDTPRSTGKRSAIEFFDSDDDDDGNSNNKESHGNNLIAKRQLPSWLAKPETKNTIKKKMKNNSLFK